MENFDETDLTILELLAEDARRPYSEIGETVGLSGPAVSDRVSRLEEAGVIRGFTLDVDRSQLQAGVPVLVELSLAPGAVEDARQAAVDADYVEHVFTTAAGDLVVGARVPQDDVRGWVTDLVDPETLRSVEVTLLDDVDWVPDVGGAGFALDCAECDNTVGSEGQAARIGDTVYHFCCPTCKARFEQRYERLDQASG